MPESDPNMPNAMTKFSAHSIGLAICLAAALWLTGCTDVPPTNTDDIAQYVRNGVAGAKVRRLDPLAQAYVDRVFKHYKQWHEQCADIAELADLDALKPRDHEHWRDATIVADRIESITKWLADEPENTSDAKNITDGTQPPEQDDPDRPKTRSELLADLSDAIADVPAVPVGSVTDLDDVVRVELNVSATESTYQRIASQHKALYEFVADNQSSFDSEADGLVFEDTDVTASANVLWDELHQTLSSMREHEISIVSELLSQGIVERERVLESKRDLRDVGLNDETARRTFRALELTIEHYDTRIKWAEKRQRGYDENLH
jgi:hypothetical protein